MIMATLAGALEGTRVVTGEEAGIAVDFKEAIAFALMGLFRFFGRSNNVPEATGARREVIMGKLCLP